MAWNRQTLFFFLFTSSFFLLSPGNYAAQKVSVALYYETLCPYCSRFIVHSLSKIFSDGLISVVDLHLVPFGNALVGSNHSISCQHGPSECFLNTVEACAINSWPDVRQHFKFIYCVENLVLYGDYNEWESCFQKVGLNPHPLVECYNNGHGQEVELEYAAQTNALQPPHSYVPWVVVNGVPLYDDYYNFEDHICKSYGGDLPIACRHNQMEKRNQGSAMNYTANYSTSGKQ